ncbi:putative transcription factor B3-Domain family [Helianthus anomalus]
MFVSYFMINTTTARMSFYKSMSALTKEFLVIPVHFSKIWLSSAVGDNIVVIKCINAKVWNVNFSKNNTEGWSEVMADLSLPEGSIHVFRKIDPYTYFLTPFFKETPYPRCEPNFSMFTSIYPLPNRKYIEAFCHVFNDQMVNTLLLPTYFVKNTIDLGKLRGSMTVHVNSSDSLDVSVEKDPVSKCYFFTDGWNNIVQHLGVRGECVVVLRYQFDYNFQLTFFYVNGCDVIVTRGGLQVNSDSNLRNATPLVNTVDDVEDDVDLNSDLDLEVAALFEPSDTDESVVGSYDSDISIDVDFDEDDDEYWSGASNDDKQDPDYHPVEFLTFFDVNGYDVIVTRGGLQVNSDSNLRNATPLVNTVDDVEDDVDLNSDLDPEVAALFEPSDTDESVVGSNDSDISIDVDFDEDDDEYWSGASNDDKQDPDYHPVEFVWEYHPRH